MKLYQKSAIKNSVSFLAVNPNTFAELIEETDSTYIFNLSFKLLVDKDSKIFDYESVDITVKNKEDNDDNQTDETYNSTSEVSGRDTNPSKGLTWSGNGKPRPKYSEKIKNRLYHNLKLLSDIQKSENQLFHHTVSLSPYLAEVKRNIKYNITEIFARSYKPKRETSSKQDVRLSFSSEESGYEKSIAQVNSSFIDPIKSIFRVNRELCSLTESIDDDSISSLSSESLLENPNIRMSFVARGKSPLYFDILKYYLRDIPASPEETRQTCYEKRKVTKTLNYIDLNQRVVLKKSNKNLNLTVRFDLFKKGSCVPDETLNADVYVPSHVDAFENVFLPPVVTYQQDFLSKNSSSRSILNTLSIVDKNKRNITGFNIYKKSIDEKGNVENYQLIGTSDNKSPINYFQFIGDSNLTIVRVVPVNKSNKETNVFSSLVIGPGHKTLGNISIVPCHFGKNEIRVDVHGIPDDTITMTLYRRDCTDNFNSSFKSISELRINKNNEVGYFLDRQVEIGHVYEYYVVTLSVSRDKKEEIPHYSNFAIYKNIPNGLVEKAVVVDLVKPIIEKSDKEIKTSFEIKTTITQSENERITQSLKDQVGELYEQYLSPLANSSSPLGGDEKGVPQYSDLFFHEIVRTNLNTGDREIFNLVSDGKFVDDKDSQKIFNIKPINPFHSYYYHVFTFRKNPIELFKNFVVRGTDSRGKDWFFLPYKWRNASLKRGKLYPDDENGIPIVDSYESFTSESYGLTAVYRIDGTIEYNDIENVTVERIDRNTNKITWSFKDENSSTSKEIYDSFVVLKVVNGIRSIVGKTQKSHVYHELKEEDLGTVYYIVVPITFDFKIDKPKFSNSVTITPDGITAKSKVFTE